MTCDDDMVPTAVEAIATVLGGDFKQEYAIGLADEIFRLFVNTALREHRLSYELIGNEIVEFAPRELHAAVVSPTLSLLRTADKAWEPVERAYHAALEEISNGEGADAITDAGTALQEALVLLGCDGNALGPLIKSARKTGVIAGHDAPMAEAIQRVMQWVSADRSESGDSHSAATASVDDAWLMVHVVGALLLRLSKGSRRVPDGLSPRAE